MIKALLVDDEEKATALLRMKLNEYCPDVEVVGEAEGVNEAIGMIKLQRPDLIFLDIGMVGKTGFDLLEEIGERKFHVIFVTAHPEFAIKAFHYSVTDYLLKPVNNDLLKQSVQKVKKLVEDADQHDDRASHQTLRIPSLAGTVFVRLSSIVRMEADGSYTRIYTDEGKVFVGSYRLKMFEEHLDPDSFIRIHRSHIVNKNMINSIVDKDGLFVVMKDGATIEVAKRNRGEFRKRMR